MLRPECNISGRLCQKAAHCESGSWRSTIVQMTAIESPPSCVKQDPASNAAFGWTKGTVLSWLCAAESDCMHTYSGSTRLWRGKAADLRMHAEVRVS